MQGKHIQLVAAPEIFHCGGIDLFVFKVLLPRGGYIELSVLGKI